MPGIVGIVADQPPDRLAQSLDRMIDPMLLMDFYRVEKQVDTHAAMSSIAVDEESGEDEEIS